MKLNDLLEAKKQAKFPNVAINSLPGIITSPGMDQYYEFYRFLVAIAGYPERDTALDGPIRDGPVMTPYTKIEQDHVIELLNKMGKPVKLLNIGGNSESDNRHTVSPVRKFVDPDEGK